MTSEASPKLSAADFISSSQGRCGYVCGWPHVAHSSGNAFEEQNRVAVKQEHERLTSVDLNGIPVGRTTALLLIRCF